MPPLASEYVTKQPAPVAGVYVPVATPSVTTLVSAAVADTLFLLNSEEEPAVIMDVEPVAKLSISACVASPS